MTTHQASSPLTKARSSGKYLMPLILVTSLFFFWGFVHNLDPILIPHLRKAFKLTDTASALVDFSVFIAYFIMAIPAGYVIRKWGYKSGIILGLVLFAIGAFLFIPAADTRVYTFFLAALFVVSVGLTFLETAANPYVTALGDPKTATVRLNFAQSFNGLAACLAPIVGAKLILSKTNHTEQDVRNMGEIAYNTYVSVEAASVKGPYMILGILIVVVAVLFALTKLPEIKEKENIGRKPTLLGALRHKNLRLAIVAQFFYVGAQVCVLSFFVRYVSVSAGLDDHSGAFYTGIAGLFFMLGRFAGTFFMRYLAPSRLLMRYALACMLLSVVAIFARGMVTVYALIAMVFFMSIMFPTIFSLGVSGLGKNTKTGSSLIVMSIIGGALLPLGFGYISDLTGSIQYSYVVPLVCFCVVFLFGKYVGQPGSNQLKNNP